MSPHLQSIVEAFGWALLHFLWQGAAAAALLALAAFALRPRSPNLRYGATLLALVALPAAFVATLATSWPPAAAPARAGSLSAPVAAVPGPAPAAIPVSPISAPSPPASPPGEPRTSPERGGGSASQPLPPVAAPGQGGPGGALRWLVAAWAVGVALSAARAARAWWGLRSCRRRARPVCDPAWGRRIASLCSAFGASRAVRVLVSATAPVPMVVGWIKPCVLIPAGLFSGLSVAQLEAILAHELAHVRRWDYLANLLQAAVEVVFFFHPAVWWISAAARREREHCCDDAAARHCGDPLRYARALAALEEWCGTGEPSTLAVPASGSPLLARVRRLVAEPERHCSVSAPGLVGLITALVAAAWAAGAHLANAGDSPESSKLEEPDPAEVGFAPAPDHGMAGSLIRRWAQLEGEGSPLPESRVAGVRRAIGQWIEETAPAEDTAAELRRLASWHGDRAEHPADELGPWLDAIAAVHPGPVQLAFNHEPRPGYAIGQGEIDTLPFGPAGENGLRAAFTLVPKKGTYIFGDELHGVLTLWNTGEETLTTGIGPAVPGLRPPLRFTATGADGREIGIYSPMPRWQSGSPTPFEGVNFTAQHRLRPGEAAAIGGYRLKVGDGPARELASAARHSSQYAMRGLRSGELITLRTSLPYPKAPGDGRAYPAMGAGELTFQVMDPADVPIWVATRAGTWPMAGGVTLQITQEVFHGADVLTNAVLRWPDGRSAVIGIAGDAFANREPWAAAWEAGTRVLWIATGDPVGPGQDFSNRQILKAVRRVDFRDPTRIVKDYASGWPEATPEGVRAVLSERLEGGEEAEVSATSISWAIPGEPATIGRSAWEILLSVGADGISFCQEGGPEQPVGQLAETLKKIADQKQALVLPGLPGEPPPAPPLTATVFAHADTPFNAVNKVIEICRAAGINRVKLASHGEGLLKFKDRTVEEWDAMLGPGYIPSKHREPLQSLGYGTPDEPVPAGAEPMLRALVANGQPATICRCLGILRRAEAPSDATLDAVVGVIAREDLGGNRSRAGYLLAEFPERADYTVPKLIELLSDSDSGGQRWAAAALGKLGPAAKGAVAPLEALLARATDPDLRDAVEGALTAVRGAE